MIIKRDYYLKKIIDKRENGRIKIITGIRRCGKSWSAVRAEIECIAMQKFKIFAYGCACQFRVIAIRILFNPLHAVSERNISEFIASESIFSNGLHTARKLCPCQLIILESTFCNFSNGSV